MPSYFPTGLRKESSHRYKDKERCSYTKRELPETKHPPKPKEEIMKQYVLSPDKLMGMLEKAFVAGYESPIEMIDQEIVKIYKEAFAELHAVGVRPEESPIPTSPHPQVMFDTDTFLKDQIWRAS